jgi:hypothetical protein
LQLLHPLLPELLPLLVPLLVRLAPLLDRQVVRPPPLQLDQDF